MSLLDGREKGLEGGKGMIGNKGREGVLKLGVGMLRKREVMEEFVRGSETESSGGEAEKGKNKTGDPRGEADCGGREKGVGHCRGEEMKRQWIRERQLERW